MKPSSSHTLHHSTTGERTSLRAAMGTLILGGIILAMVGFAPQPVFHNAAHDTRHVAVFPCH